MSRWDWRSLRLDAGRFDLAHFAVSASMNFPKSAGEPANGLPPRSARRAFTVGSARPALLARRPTKVAAIALANKIARMAWAMMARGECYKEPAALAA